MRDPDIVNRKIVQANNWRSYFRLSKPGEILNVTYNIFKETCLNYCFDPDLFGLSKTKANT